MSDLRAILEAHVGNGSLPGTVGLVGRGDQIEVAAMGDASLGGSPMARDSIFRFASITKPITAAAVMLLVDDAAIGLDDPVDPWLPELAAPAVVATPGADPDDVVPAARKITVRQDAPRPWNHA
jgi:CubicO group peptidase (beta-lactamase class C family)